MRPIVTKNVDGKPVEVPLSEAWPALVRLVHSMRTMIARPPEDMTWAGVRHGALKTRTQDLDEYTLGWTEDATPELAKGMQPPKPDGDISRVWDPVLKGEELRQRVEELEADLAKAEQERDTLRDALAATDLESAALRQALTYQKGLCEQTRSQLSECEETCNHLFGQRNAIWEERDRYHAEVSRLSEELASLGRLATASANIKPERKPPQGGTGLSKPRDGKGEG